MWIQKADEQARFSTAQQSIASAAYSSQHSNKHLKFPLVETRDRLNTNQIKRQLHQKRGARYQPLIGYKCGAFECLCVCVCERENLERRLKSQFETETCRMSNRLLALCLLLAPSQHRSVSACSRPCCVGLSCFASAGSGPHLGNGPRFSNLPKLSHSEEDLSLSCHSGPISVQRSASQHAAVMPAKS